MEESKLSKLREVKKEETSDSLHKPRGFLFSHVVTQPPVKPRSTPLSTASPSIYLTVMSEHNTIGRDATVHHAHHPPPPKPKIVPHVEEIESSEDEEEEEENDPLASLTPMFPTNVREVRRIILLNIWVLKLFLFVEGKRSGKRRRSRDCRSSCAFTRIR